jgi:hypothetical protein
LILLTKEISSMSGVENTFIRPFSNPPGVQQTSGLETSKATGPSDDAAFKAGGKSGGSEPSEGSGLRASNFGPGKNKHLDDG